MALRKRNPSSKVTKAEKRLEAMINLDKQHEKTINYGGEQYPLTVEELRNQIEECKMINNEYNKFLEMADLKSSELKNSENKLGDLYTRVLAGAKSIFGVDSDEIEVLGGTKKSDRKQLHRKFVNP